MKDSLNIAIAGATGYVGLELIKILSRHPKVKIAYLCANKSTGKSINYFDKRIKNKNLPKISKINKVDWKKVNSAENRFREPYENGDIEKIKDMLKEKWAEVEYLKIHGGTIWPFLNRLGYTDKLW